MRPQRGLTFSERPITRPKGSPEPALTLQEREIVRLVSEGHETKEIARDLHISERALENCLTKLYEKTGVTDRLGLALYAVYLMQVNWKSAK